MLFFSQQSDLSIESASAVNLKTGWCDNDRNINASQDDNCRFKRSDVGATCSGYSDVTPSGDESALQWSVANVGPVSVAVDAENFQNYESGGLSLTRTVLFIKLIDRLTDVRM